MFLRYLIFCGVLSGCVGYASIPKFGDRVEPPIGWTERCENIHIKDPQCKNTTKSNL